MHNSCMVFFEAKQFDGHESSHRLSLHANEPAAADGSSSTASAHSSCSKLPLRPTYFHKVLSPRWPPASRAEAKEGMKIWKRLTCQYKLTRVWLELIGRDKTAAAWWASDWLGPGWWDVVAILRLIGYVPRIDQPTCQPPPHLSSFHSLLNPLFYLCIVFLSFCAFSTLSLLFCDHSSLPTA